MNELLERVLLHEGFRTKPYMDTLGVSTFGHGLTYITYEESKNIVRDRMRYIWNKLSNDNWVAILPEPIQGVLIEMAFQLGMTGLSKFKKMWTALEKHDYPTAADEMLDSKWAKQTPGRATLLSDIVRHAN